MSARQGGTLLGERLLLERGRDGGDGEPGRPGLYDEGLAVKQVLLEDLAPVQDVAAHLHKFKVLSSWRSDGKLNLIWAERS